MTVFASYSSRDKDAVKSLTQDLHDADEQVWMDQRLAGGWCLECSGKDYLIQHYADGEHFVLHDKIRAGAEFLVRYLNVMSDVLKRYH